MQKVLLEIRFCKKTQTPLKKNMPKARGPATVEQQAVCVGKQIHFRRKTNEII